jgi:hypothetical protein
MGSRRDARASDAIATLAPERASRGLDDESAGSARPAASEATRIARLFGSWKGVTVRRDFDMAKWRSEALRHRRLDRVSCVEMELSPVGEPAWLESLDVSGPSWSSSARETTYKARCTATLRVQGRCLQCAAEVEGEVVAEGRGLWSRDPDNLLDLVRDVVDQEAPLEKARAAARQEALDRARRTLQVARCPVCRRRDPARERQAAWCIGLGCAAIGLPWAAFLALRRVAWFEARVTWTVAIALVASCVGVATVWGQVARLKRAEKIRLTPRPSRAAGL